MTEPAGRLMLAQNYLKATLAASATFQTWVEAEDATEALGSIHHDGLPDPTDPDKGYTAAELTALRPYALIWTQEQAGFSLARTAYETWQESGRLKLLLIQDVPAAIATDIAEADLRWKNTIGQIIDDLAALAGGAGYLAIARIDLDDGPFRLVPDKQPEQGDAQGVELGITHGGAA